MKGDNIVEFWRRLRDRYGRRRINMLTYLIGVGLVALVMQFLMFNNLYHSALLYVLVPYLISLAITLFRSYDEPRTRLQRFSSHVLTALSVLFSTSILIGEGFICILFFAPIYLIIVSVTYLISALSRDSDNKYSLALPTILFAMVSLEGSSTDLSLPRQTSVEVNKVTSLTVSQIKENLAQPFDLDKQRHWLISIFPMPYRIDAGSLNTGDVHTVYTRYHRWFVANTHEGKSELLIESVGANKITTKVLSDTTYFSTYLSGSGTEIFLDETPDGQTSIRLKLNYRRNLDPAWYFHPLQKYAAGKMGELIIDELMIRQHDL